MKTYGGLEFHKMEMSGQLHASAALPSGKQKPVAVIQEAGWAPEPVLTLWTREKSLASG
jgi:hypothetical protein